ncbi:AAA family ATPase, partial [Vibrio harveyi]|uniref:AAA family ATPase n=2 Tax=Vibrio harveyi TaxID=669 RepID=UPI0006822E29
QNCSFTNDGCKVLVYNQKFIQENFYAEDTINGIFSLSKENKEAKEKIEELVAELDLLDKDSTFLKDRIIEQNRIIEGAKRKAQETVWGIKKDYSGGDRVLEFCLKGKMGRKDVLFDHLCTIPLPTTKPTKTVEELKEEVAAIDGDTATTYAVLPKISLSSLSADDKAILSEIIVGSEDSPVSKLIGQLKNSDWVSDGLKYLDQIEDGTCPFCQSHTITEELVAQIKDYFDESYEESKAKIVHVYTKYEKIVESLPEFEGYKTTPFVADYLADMAVAFATISEVLKTNLDSIGKKKAMPSLQVELADLSEFVLVFNENIDKVNHLIGEHNAKIANSDKELDGVKAEFWNIVRYEYEQTISSFDVVEKQALAQVKKFVVDKKAKDASIKQKEEERLHYQKQTVNIEDSIENINKGLLDIGITDFYIEKYQDELYRLVRTGSEGRIFLSLSEGEKMIISFLYFRELFRGKQTADEGQVKKIAVIDDPVSSLSHIFVYNIGQLLKSDFFNSDNVEQVFVLTHSLYFFYELVDSNHRRRKDTQSLFRLVKNSKGTSIEKMKYEEVQNDYQSY